MESLKREKQIIFFIKLLLIVSLILDTTGIVAIAQVGVRTPEFIFLIIQSVLLIIFSFLPIIGSYSPKESVQSLFSVLYTVAMGIFVIFSIFLVGKYSVTYWFFFKNISELYFWQIIQLSISWLNLICGIGSFVLTVFREELSQTRRDKDNKLKIEVLLLKKIKKKYVVVLVVLLTIMAGAFLPKIYVDHKLKTYLYEEKKIPKDEVIVIDKTKFDFKYQIFRINVSTEKDMKKSKENLKTERNPKRAYRLSKFLFDGQIYYYGVFDQTIDQPQDVLKRELVYPPTDKELGTTGQILD
ncbi:hypothetical protein [Vagococcus silagei]|uniref:Uncharacterized protein n=1 Tax=Vagococcus silagei TaxID=2508885 RepID=A0A4S3B3Q5_9ENTE|nr:hypothetical protein [Vagococcus silagei]THB60203.1 hypothetical protein ESZ54_11670 [Vagococcus silagei]